MTTSEMNLTELTNQMTLTMAALEAATKRMKAKRAKATLNRKIAALQAQLKTDEATPPAKEKTDIGQMISPAQKKALAGFAKLVKSYTGGQ